jgi:HrpA-like RNA helicase
MQTKEKSSSSERVLGNPELPIWDYKQQIIDLVNSNQAVVLTAETGAGKSTQVPQFLAEAGYSVVVTQPRVLAARSVSERVSEEAGIDNLVGYRTAKERDTHPDNEILFCTDGLQVVRELCGNGVDTEKNQVLVLDEVHEWNINMEVLIAWAKERMKSDPTFKVVTMSATLDGPALAKYFGETTPHIEVPGRTFEVEKREGGHYIDEIVAQARLGKNILVFLPGKNEIDQAADALAAKSLGLPIILLHGQLDKNEQKKAFAHYSGGKIILATNVAQTSITIEDVDVVIDTGLERRNEVRGGVEGLYLAPISQADSLQRAGRAGRTKEGEYILSDIDSKPVESLKERPAYAKPEIQRVRLDNVTLKLSATGFDIGKMDFFHQPKASDIEMSKTRLERLGALGAEGQVTPVGRKMERMPLEAHFSRMLIEADKYPPEVRQKLIEVIAIQQVGGIVMNGKNKNGWKSLASNRDSDMLAELEVFKALQNIPRDKWYDYHVIGKNVGQVKSTAEHMKRALGSKQEASGAVEDKDALLKCIAAGLIDQAWVRMYGGYTSVLDGGYERELSSSSCVTGADVVVGVPFDLQIKDRRGYDMTLMLLQSATRIKPEWLAEIAPQLVTETVEDAVKFEKNGDAVTDRVKRYGSLEVGRELTPAERKASIAAVAGKLVYHNAYTGHISALREFDQMAGNYGSSQRRLVDIIMQKLEGQQLEDGPVNLIHSEMHPPRVEPDELFGDADFAKVDEREERLKVEAEERIKREEQYAEQRRMEQERATQHQAERDAQQAERERLALEAEAERLKAFEEAEKLRLVEVKNFNEVLTPEADAVEKILRMSIEAYENAHDEIKAIVNDIYWHVQERSRANTSSTLDAWVTKALQLVNTDLENALAASEEAKELDRKFIESIPSELLESVAGKVEVAKEFMQRLSQLQIENLNLNFIRSSGTDKLRAKVNSIYGGDFFISINLEVARKLIIEEMEYYAGSNETYFSSNQADLSQTTDTVDLDNSLASLAAKFSKN